MLGVVAILALQAQGSRRADEPAPSDPTPEASPSSETPTPAAAPSPSASPLDQGRLLLVWTPGGLPDGLAARVAEIPGVLGVTVVRGDNLELVGTRAADGSPVQQLVDGWRVPLDAMAIDPTTYAELVPGADRDAVRALTDGGALLGRTSADLRGIGAGGVLSLANGEDVTITGVVDDEVVGAAELVVPASEGDRVGVTTPRSLLLRYADDRTGIEVAIRGALPAETPARIRGPGESPFLRHGDAVLPQALIKDRFGEFTYRGAPGRGFEQEPAWIERNVVDADVPILGTVRCHRGIVRALSSALAELERRGLAELLDPTEYAGCWNPRFIGNGRGVSRHAWGVGIDVNAASNPYGAPGNQDPRLVEVMERWGFTWGGTWLIPDAMHFEFAEPPLEAPGD